MKKFGIIVIALAMLVGMTGFAMADTGVNATFETQGVSVATTVQAEGNMDASTDVAWVQSDIMPIAFLPEFPTIGTYYASTYTDTTQNNGVGLIAYDKNTELETKARLTNQYNIEATKQLNYVGLGGSEVTSKENIFVDGTGAATKTEKKAICVFAAGTSEVIPAFCNVVDMGSEYTASNINVLTNTNDRFVTPSADTPVTLNHNIRVTDTTGEVSAYVKGTIMEGRDLSCLNYNKIDLKDRTDVDGYIALFDKDMQWVSGIRRV